jgi:hypothetical protein
LHKDAAAEANNVIIGRTWLDADQVRAGDALGLSKADRIKLRDLGQGEFYAFGPAFMQPGIVHLRSDQVRTTHPRPGERHLLSAPAPSHAIRGVLAKFADLPLEAEEEIRDLSAARRRIVELERQIKTLGNGNSHVQQIDQAAIERAVTSAVERERGMWKGKLDAGKAHFRKLAAALVSTERSLAEIKQIVEKTEREWSATPPHPVSLHPLDHRLEPSAKTIKKQQLTENGDATPKLAAGERKILTALAQYPEGRSKVQVALLTGYAGTGGGFNNYLGALRSRLLIEGTGDRLAITDYGIHALGSWEPLPLGAALIDYWRSRLGKAERLILETLAQAYPKALSKEEVAAQAGYEASGGGFNNALGRLRTLELVQGRGELRASGDLFEGPI